MALKLVKPRAGKSPYYYVRGTYGGQSIDASTKAKNEKDARQFKNALERRLDQEKFEDRKPGTFKAAADLFKAFKSSDHRDTVWIGRICALIGDMDLADIRQSTLVKMANDLYPDAAPETKNRQALAIASGILHYAAENNMCPYIRVKKFKTKTPESRSLTKDQAQVIIASAEGKMKTLVTWLFYQGWRISDVLRLTWADLDFKNETVRYHISKTDDYRVMPLHPRVIEAFNLETKGIGRVFPWGNKSNLYREMGDPTDKKSFRGKLGFLFTPHMARHSFATWLANEGVSPLEIMEAGGWKDHKSVLRYAKLDPTRVRTIIGKIK